LALLATVLVLAVLLLAYANGANDNYKGVATLLGSGTASYRVALAWATVTTLAGSLLALALAGGLVQAFSGKGLVPDEVAGRPHFLLTVSLGTAATVLLATRVGMPVSTTHALIGALIGAGLLADAGEIRLTALGGQFVLPLLLSPVASLLCAAVLYPALRLAGRRSGLTGGACVCVNGLTEQVRPGGDGILALARTPVGVEVAEADECRSRYAGRVPGVEVGRAIDGFHFLSGGAIGFARGLNDTPKLVALLVASQALPPDLGLGLVAAAIAVGGVTGARRVAETLSGKITRLSPGQGLTANLTTSLLVAAASLLALPVSATHVSVGSMVGIGLVNGTARRRTIQSILVAWVTTLPTGAALTAVAYLLLGLAPSP
jgi:PiT family inorganic phosphate transporter